MKMIKIILFIFVLASSINADKIKLGTSKYQNISGYNISYKRNLGKLDKDYMGNALELSLKQLYGDNITEPKLRISKTKYTSSYEIEVFTSYANRESTKENTANKTYKWDYFDAGIKTTFFDGHWEFGIELAYQKAMKPTMTASSLKYDLSATKGRLYKIPLGYNFNKNYKLELEYEYNKWQIGSSTFEDSSVSKNKIYNLNFVYNF